MAFQDTGPDVGYTCFTGKGQDIVASEEKSLDSIIHLQGNQCFRQAGSLLKVFSSAYRGPDIALTNAFMESALNFALEIFAE